MNKNVTRTNDECESIIQDDEKKIQLANEILGGAVAIMGTCMAIALAFFGVSLGSWPDNFINIFVSIYMVAAFIFIVVFIFTGIFVVKVSRKFNIKLYLLEFQRKIN